MINNNELLDSIIKGRITPTKMKYLKSRTIWTCIVIVLVNGVPALFDADLVPKDLLQPVNLLLGFLAAYFRITPKVK